MNTEYPLTLVDFELWLKSKDEKDFVGVRGCYLSCPILKCLENTRHEVIGVGERSTNFLVPNKRHYTLENPKWISSFIREIDKPGLSSKVTVKEALKVLNNLYICTVCNKYNPEGTNCGKKDNCPW